MQETTPGTHDDPAKILEVNEGASDEEIRAAYLRKVRQYPPDRSPAEFERVRDAYHLLRDPRARARLMFLSSGSDRPLSALADAHGTERRFVGPELWRESLRERPGVKEDRD